MAYRGLLAMLVLLALGVSGQAWAESSPVTSIASNDHATLATYYFEQAREQQEKAKFWDMMADAYEKHKDSAHATHCRTIAQSYKKAAEETNVLAREHRAKGPEPRTHQ